MASSLEEDENMSVAVINYSDKKQLTHRGGAGDRVISADNPSLQSAIVGKEVKAGISSMCQTRS